MSLVQTATQTLQFFRGKLRPHIDIITPALPAIALLILGEEQEIVSAASYIAERWSESKLQLEFKSNIIAHFDWQELAAHLQSFIAITFEKNDFLKDVDEAQMLQIFGSILQRPYLSLKPHEFLSYLQKKSEKHLSHSVVCNDACMTPG
jgi:hypothetical protein